MLVMRPRPFEQHFPSLKLWMNERRICTAYDGHWSQYILQDPIQPSAEVS